MSDCNDMPFNPEVGYVDEPPIAREAKVDDPFPTKEFLLVLVGFVGAGVPIFFFPEWRWSATLAPVFTFFAWIFGLLLAMCVPLWILEGHTKLWNSNLGFPLNGLVALLYLSPLFILMFLFT